MNIDNNKVEDLSINLKLTFYKDTNIDPNVWR